LDVKVVPYHKMLPSLWYFPSKVISSCICWRHGCPVPCTSCTPNHFSFPSLSHCCPLPDEAVLLSIPTDNSCG